MVDDSTQTHGPDIGRQQLGAVYAKAFLGAMEKANATDQMMAELDVLIREILDRYPGFDATLSSLRLSAKEKAAVLDRVLGGRVSEPLMSFLKVVNAHSRLDCLREIYREARRQLNDQRGIVDVHLTTAVPVQDELAGQISDVLRTTLGRDVHLLQAIDPDVIGGMLIRVGDKVFDSSVVNQLKQLREETLEKTIQEMRNASARFIAAE